MSDSFTEMFMRDWVENSMVHSNADIDELGEDDIEDLWDYIDDTISDLERVRDNLDLSDWDIDHVRGYLKGYIDEHIKKLK